MELREQKNHQPTNKTIKLVLFFFFISILLFIYILLKSILLERCYTNVSYYSYSYSYYPSIHSPPLIPNSVFGVLEPIPTTIGLQAGYLNRLPVNTTTQTDIHTHIHAYHNITIQIHQYNPPNWGLAGVCMFSPFSLGTLASSPAQRHAVSGIRYYYYYCYKT